MTTDYTYTDIDLDFLADNNGDITLLRDELCVKQSLRNIILTIIKELSKYQREDFGSKVYYYLGEKINKITALSIEDDIRNAINNFEERIEIINIVTNTNDNNYDITLTYKIISINLSDSISITLDVLT